MMSTPMFVDPEISTQADRAQSSRVPVPLIEDPYEAIRQAYLVKAVTESEPFEDLVETKAPELPHTVASPTSLPASTPPKCHVEESEDSDMSGARFTSSDSTTLLSPNHPLTHTTLALVPSLRRTESMADDDEEEDDEEENEEIQESSDSNSESEGTKDEGPTAEDEDPAVGDEGDKAVPKGQQRATSIVETIVGEPLGLGYGVLRHQEIVSREGQMPSVFETPLSPEWSSGSLPVSPAPSIIPLPISSPMISLIVPLSVASPATAEAKGFLTELGARVEMEGGLIY
ncbi:hypothetical protein Tco_1566300, partial [Tanacetum coccineum]